MTDWLPAPFQSTTDTDATTRKSSDSSGSSGSSAVDNRDRNRDRDRDRASTDVDVQSTTHDPKPRPTLSGRLVSGCECCKQFSKTTIIVSICLGVLQVILVGIIIYLLSEVSKLNTAISDLNQKMVDSHGTDDEQTAQQTSLNELKENLHAWNKSNEAWKKTHTHRYDSITDRPDESETFFSAYLAKDYTVSKGNAIKFKGVNVNINKGENIKKGRKKTNTDGYNKDKGKFTCPISGYYKFDVTLRSNDKVSAALVINEEVVFTVSIDQPNAGTCNDDDAIESNNCNFETSTNSAIILCCKGKVVKVMNLSTDKVKVTITGAGGDDGDPPSTFTGFFIKKATDQCRN